MPIYLTWTYSWLDGFLSSNESCRGMEDGGKRNRLFCVIHYFVWYHTHNPAVFLELFEQWISHPVNETSWS